MNAILKAIEDAGDNGDTTLKSYGGFRVKDGAFVFDKVIEL
jgi:hypothetical protein